MGGDNAPACVIEGINFLEDEFKKDLFFLLYGDEKKINKYLSKYPQLKNIT